MVADGRGRFLDGRRRGGGGLTNLARLNAHPLSGYVVLDDADGVEGIREILAPAGLL